MVKRRKRQHLSTYNWKNTKSRCRYQCTKWRWNDTIVMPSVFIINTWWVNFGTSYFRWSRLVHCAPFDREIYFILCNWKVFNWSSWRCLKSKIQCQQARKQRRSTHLLLSATRYLKLINFCKNVIYSIYGGWAVNNYPGNLP